MPLTAIFALLIHCFKEELFVGFFYQVYANNTVTIYFKCI